MLDSNKLSFQAADSTALAANRRVALNSSGKIDYAGAADRAIGTLLTDIDASIVAHRVGAVLQFATGIHWGTYASSTALAVGDELQAAANGKIDKRTTGACVGIAVETAAADGDVIRYLPVIAEGPFTGEGGAVTQATSASTGVTLNKHTGQITTVALTTAAGAEEVFTVSNSKVTSTDVVEVATTYAGAGVPLVGVKAVANGSFDLVITNLHASAALNAALVVNFRIRKGAIA